MNTLELKMDTGDIVYVEVAPSHSSGGLQEVSRGAVSAQFSKVASSISSVVSAVENQLSKLPSRPDMFQVEIGAELKGEAELWIASGEASGHFKITMKWEKG